MCNLDKNNFTILKKKEINICNDCLKIRYIDKYNEFKGIYTEHFECRRFLYLKKLTNWEFTYLDIFKLISYFDYYLPTMATHIPMLDDMGLESPLLKRVVKESNEFETNLLIRLVHQTQIKPRYCKTEVSGIYIVRNKYHVYITRNRKSIFGGSYKTLEEAIINKIALTEKYAREN